MLLPVPAMLSISSYDPTTLPLTASVMTCRRDGVWPSGCQPLTTVSQDSLPAPLLASTNSSGLPVVLTLPVNTPVAVRAAEAAVTLGVVLRLSGAARPTEVPAYAPLVLVRMTTSPP